MTAPETIRFGPQAEFELDEARFELRRAGQPVALEAKPFELLAYLVRHADRVVEKDELLDAVWPGTVGRLALIGPFGLFDASEPATDIWALRPGHLPDFMCRDRETYKAFIEQPDDADAVEWKVEQMRALEATARLLFPTGNTGLDKRLHRLTGPLLLLRGEADRVIPRSYLERMADLAGGDARVVDIPGAGHLAELDEPAAVAAAIERFLGD